jgi:hypothetical protein
VSPPPVRPVCGDCGSSVGRCRDGTSSWKSEAQTGRLHIGMSEGRSRARERRSRTFEVDLRQRGDQPSGPTGPDYRQAERSLEHLLRKPVSDPIPPAVRGREPWSSRRVSWL